MSNTQLTEPLAPDRRNPAGAVKRKKNAKISMSGVGRAQRREAIYLGR